MNNYFTSKACCLIKKYLLFFILFISFSLFVYADGEITEEELRQYLVNGNWTQDVNVWSSLWGDPYRGLSMEFESSDTFKIWSNWLKYYPATGSFSIIENGFETTSVDFTGYDDTYPRSKISWALKKDKSIGYSLLYSRIIASEVGVIFYDETSLLPKGTKCSFDGYNLVLTDRILYKITDNLNVREIPNINGKKLDFQLHLNGTTTDSAKEVGYLPKDRRIIPLARTETQEVIGGFQNYWYYVSIELIPGEEFGPGFGWVFGSFIEPEKSQNP